MTCDFSVPCCAIHLDGIKQQIIRSCVYLTSTLPRSLRLSCELPHRESSVGRSYTQTPKLFAVMQRFTMLGRKWELISDLKRKLHRDRVESNAATQI